MTKFALRAALLAATSLVAVAALSPAQAVVITPPLFEIDQTSGTFTVINRSTSDYIFGFDVNFGKNVSASTTQTNWSPCGSCFGDATYFNNDLGSASSAAIANDIGPGQSSSNFFYAPPNLDPPFTIDFFDLNDPNHTRQMATGFTVITTPTPVPEPATAALFGTALLGLFLGLSRRNRG